MLDLFNRPVQKYKFGRIKWKIRCLRTNFCMIVQDTFVKIIYSFFYEIKCDFVVL